jgi:ribosomal protein L21E
LNSIREKLPDILQKAFEKQKNYANRGKSNLDFYVGENFLIKMNIRKDKFSDRYEGPHTILKNINPVTYLVEINKNGRKQVEKNHVQQIKKYRDQSQIQSVYYYS